MELTRVISVKASARNIAENELMDYKVPKFNNMAKFIFQISFANLFFLDEGR